MNKFILQPLPFSYEALEPYIDMKTVEIHHNKHQKAYVDNLNLTLAPYPMCQSYSLKELIKNVSNLPSEIQMPVLNNAGGVYNHQFYWDCLQPPPIDPPLGQLFEAINRDFYSFDNFRNEFTKEALKVFGSGWCWLCTTDNGKLQIISTSNHLTPLSTSLIPILVLDVWEHAYYLKVQNNRNEYINNWFKLINWLLANKRYLNAIG
ncbi:MAG: superoxide dismutase [Oscillospiraceae bacterium]